MRFAERRQKEDKHSAVNSPPATTADKSKDLSAFLFRDCFENSPRLQKGGVNETGSFPVPRIVRMTAYTCRFHRHCVYTWWYDRLSNDIRWRNADSYSIETGYTRAIIRMWGLRVVFGRFSARIASASGEIVERKKYLISLSCRDNKVVWGCVYSVYMFLFSVHGNKAGYKTIFGV